MNSTQIMAFYAEKLCSPVMVEMITPAWSILEKAVMKAKGEID